MKARLIKFDNKILKWEDDVATAREDQVEAVENWKEIINQSAAEAQTARNSLRVMKRERDQVRIRVNVNYF